MAGKTGFGSSIAVGDGASPEVFTTIAQVKDINWAGKSAAVYDYTTHDAPNGYMQKLTGLKDGGEVTFKLVFDINATSHASLDTIFEAGVAKNYKLTPANASPAKYWAITASLSKLGAISLPVNGMQECDVTLTVTGKPTLT